METLLDRIGKVAAILAALIAITLGIPSVYQIFSQHSRLQMQIEKDRNGIPPDLLPQLTALTHSVLAQESGNVPPAQSQTGASPQPRPPAGQLADELRALTNEPQANEPVPSLLSKLDAAILAYSDPQNQKFDSDFGSVTFTIDNVTTQNIDKGILTLEVGGLTKFSGVQLVDSQLTGDARTNYQTDLAGVALEAGQACTEKSWKPQQNLNKLEVPLPALKQSDHIVLRAYGSPFESVDGCLHGATPHTQYRVLRMDSFMLNWYPTFIAGLCVVLLVIAALLFVRSQRSKSSK